MPIGVGSCLLDRAYWVWVVLIGSCLLDPPPAPKNPPLPSCLAYIFPTPPNPSLPRQQPAASSHQPAASSQPSASEPPSEPANQSASQPAARQPDSQPARIEKFSRPEITRLRIAFLVIPLLTKVEETFIRWVYLVFLAGCVFAIGF